MPTANVTALAEGSKILTFRLAQEEYGVDILRVREILGLQAITPVPGTQASLRGVINLRGRIIPVMDLRRRFGLDEALSPQSCIITVQVKRDGGEALVGLLVDAVSEVAGVAAADLEAMPSVGSATPSEEVLGLLKSQGRVRILLDIDKVVGDADVPPVAA
jgi:purine-binding chemotaxis protein CheW